jgi:hypothetical protein
MVLFFQKYAYGLIILIVIFFFSVLGNFSSNIWRGRIFLLHIQEKFTINLQKSLKLNHKSKNIF